MDVDVGQVTSEETMQLLQCDDAGEIWLTEDFTNDELPHLQYTHTHGAAERLSLMTSWMILARTN